MAESQINSIYSKCESYSEVLDFMKRQLQEDGMGSLLNFAVKIKSTDPNKKHSINAKTLQTIASFLKLEHLSLIFS